MKNNFMLSRPQYKGKYHLRAVMGNYNTKETDVRTQTKVNELMKNNYMLSRPKFKGKYYLRVVMGNYNTNESHIEELLKILHT